MSFIDKTILLNSDFTKIGEEKEFSTEIPLRGWTQLTAILLSITGSTVNRFFTVYYSYSYDAIRFTEYLPFTGFSLINLPLKNDFIIKFKFVREGTDDTGILTLNDIELQGDYSQTYFDVLDLSQTTFEDIQFDDERFNKTWINLLQKLYRKGVVPKFLDRGEDTDFDDEDYITFWKVVSYFFAYIIELSERKIGEMYIDRELLLDYLQQKSVSNCPEQSLVDLQYITSYLFDEIRQRGTFQIVEKKSISKEVDGELLRIICYQDCDEFLFEFLPRHYCGWNVNLTSPIYEGHTLYPPHFNKAPENTKDILDLGKYTLINPTKVSLQTVGTKETAKIQGDTSESGLEFEFCVDTDLSYEVTFLVKFDVENSNALTVKAFAASGVSSRSLLAIDTFSVNGEFLNSDSMSNNSVFYFVRCIVYNMNQIAISGDDAKTNLGLGKNLKFDSGDTDKLKIQILNSHTTDDIFIHDIKVKPLKWEKNPSYINSYNIINNFIRNRNKSISVIDFEEFVRRYLIPYGVIFQPSYSSKSSFELPPYLLQENGDLLLQEDGGGILL